MASAVAAKAPAVEAPSTSSSTPTTKEEAPQKKMMMISSDARYYACDATKLATLQASKPWMSNPKHFQSVAVSPCAMMKMMMHCARGVEKGISSQNGNPIEVMGLLLGRPDPEAPTTLIVTDAFPLPIEGFETRVIADDQDVVNHMIQLNESLERSRHEKFMGWYHSHPFDVVNDRSHCFLSQTDLSTQLQWQRAEDPHGNPFVAIVLDPLRASHLGLPQLKAFRAFPPEYQSPVPMECPDGSIEPSEKVRLEHWGSCWNRYYELSIEYYMSSTSRQVMEALTSKYLWISNLKTSQPTLQERVSTLEKSVDTAQRANMGMTGGGGGSGSGAAIVAAATTADAASSTLSDAMRIDPEPETAASSSSSQPQQPSQQQQQQPPLGQLVDQLSHLATQELAHNHVRQYEQRIFSVPNDDDHQDK